MKLFLLILFGNMILLFLFTLSGFANQKNHDHDESSNNNQFKAELSNTFPLLLYSSIITILLSFFYFFIYMVFLQIEFTELILTNNTFIICCIVVFCTLLGISFFNYMNAPDIIKKKKSIFFFPIIPVAFLASTAFSLVFITSTNFIFDKSTGEEKIVKITNIRVVRSKKGTTSYIEFLPQIYDIDEIIKPYEFSVKVGDKLKLTVQNGFWGIKYLNKKKELIR